MCQCSSIKKLLTYLLTYLSTMPATPDLEDRMRLISDQKLRWSASNTASVYNKYGNWHTPHSPTILHPLKIKLSISQPLWKIYKTFPISHSFPIHFAFIELKEKTPRAPGTFSNSPIPLNHISSNHQISYLLYHIFQLYNVRLPRLIFYLPWRLFYRHSQTREPG